MADEHPEEVRILTQGRLHKGYRDPNGNVFTLEGDNLDTADGEVYALGDLAGIVTGIVPLCARCFGA